jgi:cell division topological specificity factor
MFEFFTRLFRSEPSGQTAKERLRLVLLSDHLALAPDVVEAMKTDLLAVISRYVEVDEANVEVTFEQRDHEVAMLANIPIRSMKERERPRPKVASIVPFPKAETIAAVAVAAGLDGSAPIAPPPDGAQAPAASLTADESEKAQTAAAAEVALALGEPIAERKRPASKPRKRRRRKSATRSAVPQAAQPPYETSAQA